MAVYYRAIGAGGAWEFVILILALGAVVLFMMKQMKDKKNGKKSQNSRGGFMQEKNAPSTAIGLGVFVGSVMYTKLLIAAVLAISAISDIALYIGAGFRLPILMLGLVKFVFAAIVYADVKNCEKAMERELGRRK